MAEKHTPGPWTYNDYTKTIRGPYNHWIATMDSFDGAVNNQANARLIAAAPEMLTFIEKVRLQGETTESTELMILAKEAETLITQAAGPAGESE
ncbi:hypothetical protein KAR91_27355 [Candidatus Pacearchaeota archaeon]|nr:hypothetical protein [Candidatus Pacearchaeota archaeon]